MTNFYYSCKEDENLIKESFNNIANIIFGSKNQDKIKKFKEYWEKMVSNVSVFPQGTITAKINPSIPGICRRDSNTDKIIIEMLGYKDASNNQYLWIKHEGSHEFCHYFADLMPKIFAENNEGIIKGGILCENQMGLIKESNPSTKELVGQHYYGKMFNETMMDIITSMSLNCFDSNTNSKKIYNILHCNYNNSGMVKSSYSIFTSLTRLAIAAFSNVSNPDYDDYVKNGYGIFNATTIFKNDETHMVNDFLYGIIYDPLHIEKEFDKYMGDGSYREFCEFLDRLFITSLNNQKISSAEVKKIMNVLPDFLNKKMNYYRKNELLDPNHINQIVSNFNEIWNALQTEYGAYFSQGDIDGIAERAGIKKD
jgi:hypothetical protein